MACVITLLARKGGSGRTTLAINLASAFAQAGDRVVVVDLDTQASASQFYLGSERVSRLMPHETVAELGTDSIHPTKWAGVRVLPAHMSAPMPTRLDLRAVDADIVLVDTPPDFQVPVIHAALASTDFALSPVLPEPFGAQSIASLPAVVRKAVHNGNSRLALLGFVINQRQRQIVHAAYEEVIRRVHGDKVFTTTISATAALKQALAAGCPITEFEVSGRRDQAAVGKAADQVRLLVAEIDDRIQAELEGRP
jgi:chromosome partitioning protein